MNTARLIHLATHGLLDPDDATTDVHPGGAVRPDAGLQSAVALAADDKSSGLLTAQEIFQLKLNADLVVLSACNSGRGAVRGDGIVGLSRAFMSAGVPSLVSSLWEVSDDATSVLMIEFYRQMERSRDKAQALRSAMLTTMRDFPEPRDWGAFQLLGRAD